MLREEVPTAISKPVLGWFAKDQIKKLNLDGALDVGGHAIEGINANRHIAFEEEVRLSKSYRIEIGCFIKEGGC